MRNAFVSSNGKVPVSDREEVLRIHALFQNGKHPSQQRLESFHSISFADVDLDWDGMGAVLAYVTVVVDEGVRRIPDAHSKRQLDCALRSTSTVVPSSAA